MTEQKSQRDRGFILTSAGSDKLTDRIRQLETKTQRRYTAQFISEQTRSIDTAGLHSKTIRKVLHGLKGVDKRSLSLIFESLDLLLEEDDYASADLPLEALSSQSPIDRCDWGEAPDVESFYGRTAELARLEQWISVENCRVVALLGMGGIGKTALSVKIAQHVREQFDLVFWKSLRNAPPLDEVLVKIVQFLSEQKIAPAELPARIEDKITLLLQYLRASRCLVVLDNAEAILASGSNAGDYLCGYEEYGELLRQVAQTQHQSCLVLTAREKPKEISIYAGKYVKSLLMGGLSTVEGRAIFREKGSFLGSEEEWKILIEHYRGNPLALKIVAAAIAELLNGNLSEGLDYLKQGTFLLNDLRDLLGQQFDRASDSEQEVMYWLAINREPVSLSQLQEDVISPSAKQKLFNTLTSLERRCLIDRTPSTLTQDTTCFTLQPVVMEYIGDRFIEQIVSEIVDRKFSLLNSHTLMKALALDYVRDIQIRLLVQPVIKRLLAIFSNQRNLEKQLSRLISQLQVKFPLKKGYAAGNILNLFAQMGTDLRGYDFSNLTVWQADLRSVNLPEVNFACADLSRSSFAEPFSAILSVASSRDGKLLAVGDTDGTIHLWDIADRQKCLTYKAHTSWVTSVAFSPDGNTIASSSGTDRTVKLWDTSDGQQKQTLRGHHQGIWCVVFSPQGNFLASSSEDAAVKLWDIQTGQCLQTFQEENDGIWSVAWSPDGQRLASVGDRHTIKLWDMQTSHCQQVLSGHTSWIRAIAFSPDGKTLASGSSDRTVRLWDISSGRCRQILQGHARQIRSVVFSPDGKTLASGSDDQTIRLWDVSSDRCRQTLFGHASQVRAIAFVSSFVLASGSEDCSVKLWDMRAGQCLRTLRGYSNGTSSVAFAPHPNNYLLASGHDDCTIKLWDVRAGRVLKTLHGHSDRVWSVAFSPIPPTPFSKGSHLLAGVPPVVQSGVGEGGILASSSADGSVRLWHVDTGRCLRQLQAHSKGVRAVAFCRDYLLASGSDDETVKLWDIRTGQCVKTLTGHTNRIRSIAIRPQINGINLLASGSDDETIKLWDIDTGQCLQTLQGHTSWVRSVAFSPDGHRLASGSDDETVKLWDIRTGQCLQTLHEHTSWVWSVAFAPLSSDRSSKSYILASGSEDRTVKLQSDREQRTLSGHNSRVCCVAFAWDGRILASGSHDETIRLWHIDTGECFKTLRSENLYEGMNLVGATGLTKAQKITLKTLGAQLEADGF